MLPEPNKKLADVSETAKALYYNQVEEKLAKQAELKDKGREASTLSSNSAKA